ncbi:MAG: hypothetical protein RL557_643 [archaeon]|jgi:hypothetical protein
MDQPQVKFDQGWVAKRPPEGPFLFHSYEHVARIASRALGKNGIVGILNARPTARQPDPEYRYEEFFDAAQKSGITLKIIDDGRAFYDCYHQIYFMKEQKISTDFQGVPVVFLATNLPLGKNLDAHSGDQILEDVYKNKCILGVAVPLCIRSLDDALEVKPDLLHHLDFMMTYIGSAAPRFTNAPSERFYTENADGIDFVHPYSNTSHTVGALAGSWNHRTPKSFLGRLWSGLGGFKQTLGSSYSVISEPSSDNYFNDLRSAVQDARLSEQKRKPIIAESIRSQFSIHVWDKTRLPHFR